MVFSILPATQSSGLRAAQPVQARVRQRPTSDDSSVPDSSVATASPTVQIAGSIALVYGHCWSHARKGSSTSLSLMLSIEPPNRSQIAPPMHCRMHCWRVAV